MRKSTLVLVAFAVLAIAEIWLLATVGQQIGVIPLLLVLIAEGLVAGWVMRKEGAKAWRSLRDAEQQRDPAKMGPAITDAALVLVGAILLLVPGFLTDLLGLVFLVPATRGVARRGLAAVLEARTRKFRDQAGLMDARLRRETVVEGQTVDAPEPPRRRPDDETVIRGEIER